MRTSRGIDARTFIHALVQASFTESRTAGSDHRFKHPDGRGVTVAFHKLSDPFPIGTLNRMLDARWDDDDMRRLHVSQPLALPGWE